jgi:N-acetylglucosaminyldiphosphoundecaprenol N-acetyl-beta-D-mannosaminyltransferase
MHCHNSGLSLGNESWQERWQCLLDRLTLCQSSEDVGRLLSDLRGHGRPVTLAFVNAHAMNLAVQSPDFYASLMAADVLVRDGVGMSILLRMHSRSPGLNLNGTDLIPELLSRFQQAPVALYGTSDEFLLRAAEKIRLQGHLGALSCLDGFQPVESYVVKATAERPELIVLGMGMPKQEAVAAQMHDILQHGCVVVCGGAIIDFIGGKVTRAPQVIRDIGLEWLYRLCLEPKRLFKRYVVGNPTFLARGIVFWAQGSKDSS